MNEFDGNHIVAMLLGAVCSVCLPACVCAFVCVCVRAYVCVCVISHHSVLHWPWSQSRYSALTSVGSCLSFFSREISPP